MTRQNLVRFLLSIQNSGTTPELFWELSREGRRVLFTGHEHHSGGFRDYFPFLEHELLRFPKLQLLCLAKQYISAELVVQGLNPDTTY